MASDTVKDALVAGIKQKHVFSKADRSPTTAVLIPSIGKEFWTECALYLLPPPGVR
jgi:hypothetical protein